MDVFFAVMSNVFEFFTMPMTVYGFTFSWWDIILWSLLASVVFSFIGRLFVD